ncbi:hypothetical protein MBM_06672 [Drepanopeziza brunnea f. sp. 'multigermtubi' MB_m1]|uniref:GPI anchored protein n=1 Tax=Marssonina brunnea f. sp. multigermtubi (strain MB_m1) TaxID=1072389 RepID=K1WR05_MARBU|nr:uncharacterized protein MBM_06672 [Drepanopeziza brunnea f. sp. 'multigermtubi' MB_m1]EKD15456.1 hypothetical protein MBM_06672 [Drepanopeziza brunnea f. sp. 'multigermtubi' MB_m1]
MLMRKSTLAILALVDVGAAAAAAANSTVSLLFPGYATGENWQVLGSIVASDAAATTYALSCADTSDDSECPIPTSFTFVEGPSTIHYQMTLPYGSGSNELNCKITPAPSPLGVCTATVAEIESSSTETSRITLSLNDASYSSYVGTLAVTITAGVAATTSSVASTTTSASPSSSKGSGSSTRSGTPAVGSPSSTSLSTGGTPMITQAPWVLGAAAALAYAAL